MRLKWILEPRDAEVIRAVVREYESDYLVRNRWERCISGSRRPDDRRETRWMAIVACRLTTQQKSGPTSPINTFLQLRPSPLALERMRSVTSPAQHTIDALQRHGGIRWYNKIAEHLADNLAFLDGGGWESLEEELSNLPAPEGPANERRVARWIGQHLKGFGRKQSRNLLQVLGLSRWEVPLDSRVLKWLEQLSLPIPLNAKLLSDRGYSEFASDLFQALCAEVDIPPAIVDAAIFASYDGGQWSEENLAW